MNFYEAYINEPPCFGLAPKIGACGLNCPPKFRGTAGAGGFEGALAEAGGNKLRTLKRI